MTGKIDKHILALYIIPSFIALALFPLLVVPQFIKRSNLQGWRGLDINSIEVSRDL
jgi:hypothetical protein